MKQNKKQAKKSPSPIRTIRLNINNQIITLAVNLETVDCSIYPPLQLPDDILELIEFEAELIKLEVEGSIRICDPVLNPPCNPSNLRFKLEEKD